MIMTEPGFSFSFDVLEAIGVFCRVLFSLLKVFQNGRPDTSAYEDITPRNLCIHSILIILPLTV